MPQTKPSRAALRAARSLPDREHRRDRREVVGIGRVPQAEHERDDDHDADRRAGRERGDLLVEAEHHATFGSAWMVMSDAGEQDHGRAHRRQRAEDDRRRISRARTRASRATAIRPTPVIDSARPRLNATISSEPERDTVQRDRREQDDERGRAGKQPARDADREQPAHARRALLLVAVVVVMVVMPVRVRAGVPPARGEHRDADRHDQQPRGEVQPRVQVVRARRIARARE